MEIMWRPRIDHMETTHGDHTETTRRPYNRETTGRPQKDHTGPAPQRLGIICKASKIHVDPAMAEQFSPNGRERSRL